jgi:DNA-binding NtrC family response regulator
MQIGVETSRAVENRRIFIIHQDEILRAALQFMLHDENEAHEIPDVDTALARAGTRLVDLVILDADIPRTVGIQTLYDIRQRMPQAKILMVADSVNDPFAELCVSRGAVGTVGKPLRLEQVRYAVDKALGRISA